MREQIKEAKSILVVGGGPTGLEVVGNLAHKYAK